MTTTITMAMMGTYLYKCLSFNPSMFHYHIVIVIVIIINDFVFRPLVKTVVYDTFPQMVLINPLDVVTLFYRSGRLIPLSFYLPFTFHPSIFTHISISNSFDYQLFLWMLWLLLGHPTAQVIQPIFEEVAESYHRQGKHDLHFTKIDLDLNDTPRHGRKNNNNSNKQS